MAATAPQCDALARCTAGRGGHIEHRHAAGAVPVPLTLMTQLAVGVALSDRPFVASSGMSLNHVGCRRCSIVSATRKHRRRRNKSRALVRITLYGASYGGQGAQLCCTSAHLWHLVSGEVWAAVARRSNGQRHPDGSCTINIRYVSQQRGSGIQEGAAAGLHQLAKPRDVVKVNAGNIAHSLRLRAGPRHGQRIYRTPLCYSNHAMQLSCAHCMMLYIHVGQRRLVFHQSDRRPSKAQHKDCGLCRRAPARSAPNDAMLILDGQLGPCPHVVNLTAG
jgi:hypothetical protein